MSADLRFPKPFPPAFASAWGDDAYGLFADFRVPGAEGEQISQRLRWIEPGEFLMGSPDTETERSKDEGPQHRVTLTQGFWLADTACTQALWQAVMGDNSSPSPSRFKGDDLPVVLVSHGRVLEFLLQLQGFVPGVVVDLPTEAEWEYACRAGTDTPFHWGATIDPTQANYDGNYPYAGGKRGEYRQRIVPVKTFAANAWGLYQMHGNVWEWCADGQRVYDGKAQFDPEGPGGDDAGMRRVVRGGAWRYDAGRLRSADRRVLVPRTRDHHLGFRFVLRSRQEAWKD